MPGVTACVFLCVCVFALRVPVAVKDVAGLVPGAYQVSVLCFSFSNCCVCERKETDCDYAAK